MGRRLWVVVLVTGLATAGAAMAQDLSAIQPQALKWAGIQDLRQSEPDLTGAGVRFGVICRSFTYSADGDPLNDYRPNVKHACFENARLAFHDDQKLAPGVSSHANAICSILFGSEAEGTSPYLDSFLYQGAVSGAEGHVYEFWHFVARYINPQEAPEIDLASLSFGQFLESPWTRGIEALIEHTGIVFVASIGNGLNASDPLFYPGAGANTIGVGVVSSVNVGDPVTKLAQFALAYPEESSVGPTHDGRCKPDVIAPGNCLVAETDADQGYEMAGNWSSYSTPVAAGVVGLLIQAARQDPDLSLAVSPQGGNCALKAVLMNSATKLPHWHKGRLTTDDDNQVPLDYVQGAGMVNAVRAHQLLLAGRSEPGDVPVAGWDLNLVQQGPVLQQVYRIAVTDPTTKMLTATLVWNRHYRTEKPFKRRPEIDSDLRLEVWAIDSADPRNPRLQLLDHCDSKVDNVEHIHIPALPGYTLYEIVVSYSDLNAKTSSPAGERYALAWSVEEKVADESIFWHDLNADGIVDEQDLAILTTNSAVERRSPQTYVIGDINMDGTIDDEDMQVMIAHRNRKADWRVETVTD